MKKQYKMDIRTLIILICIVLQGIIFIQCISAGTTNLNQDMNLKIGDCWNDKTITQVDGLKITWDKGCNSQADGQGSGTRTGNSYGVDGESVMGSEWSSPDTCQYLTGNGDHYLIITGNSLTSDDYMIDWGYWVYNDIQTRIPFNEYTYTLLYEKTEGLCDYDNYLDIRFTIAELYTYYGMSWFDGVSTNRVWFDDNLEERGKSAKWDFLLFHEIGHIFTRSEHSDDGSIMDKDGGNGKYNQEQVNTIRENLE